MRQELQEVWSSSEKNRDMAVETFIESETLCIEKEMESEAVRVECG